MTARIVSADGQRFDDVAEVLILVRHHDGREDGWAIQEPDRCEWRWGGVGVATVTVRGTFFRKAKDNASRAIEQALTTAAIDEHTRLWADEITGATDE